MTDRLKTVYQHKTPFWGVILVFSIAKNINSEATNSCFSCSVNVHISYQWSPDARSSIIDLVNFDR